MNQDLIGKIALVTGATRGIGAAIARSLAEKGAKVIGTATSAGGVDSINQALADVGGEGRELRIAEENSIENLIADIESNIGNIAILVNNAGITRDNLLMRMKEAEWDEIMQINLKSAFRASKAVTRCMMKARWGRIINVTSVVGFMGNAGQTNYAAAKAGLVGFSKSMAREVGSRGITVNCVAPGFIETDMTKALPQEQRDFFAAQTALNCLGTVEDVAAAVLFLASEEARYITGQTLHVNGGMLMP
ncbi:3-oxoacyl-[acyl-carrier-protein] reductase [Snodgrassella communis]|jgi:3-oxoacyl-[acyl-carrier protein] reductase|uniref:3-oxoacyl-[acyl-carrier-protein] reductase n=3 Tax=Neisseriaceae TaxID=481 RepID=A0A2N9XEI3_9NEIS|nr:3-oxoacyl-[acyl-carrier protein] reductase [Snodgrassella communis]PIT46021.1 3-oxoacyl-[acyl-carrier-protein] reductase [Snodgrassella alvi]KDN14493.1 3-oxoacyl-[acyl-carrier protein] reductase [Snodgrassella communis]PIT06858.1 3-oxoacyl-[acyl-carrier-protein] reductase [Snodgrassella communis]PIT19638.1 3-oxoacyl-[acyl-carrier-protein] reductase [Snodgrassella communis]